MKVRYRSIGFNAAALCLMVFVLARCLAPPAPIPQTGGESTTLPAMTMYAEAKNACVISDSVPVRKDPSVDAERAGSLARDEAVQAIGQTVDRQWYKVNFNDASGQTQSGWVAAQFIETTTGPCGPATLTPVPSLTLTIIRPTPSPTRSPAPRETETPRPTQAKATATHTPQPVVIKTTAAPIQPQHPSNTPSAMPKKDTPYTPPTPTDRPTVVPLPTDTIAPPPPTDTAPPPINPPEPTDTTAPTGIPPAPTPLPILTDEPPIYRITIVFRTPLVPIFIPTPTWTSPPTGIPQPTQGP